ncbi:MAG: asparaginase [Cyanobacteria bacterium MAG IRC1_bin_28]|nr:asparaginase [Cyanobacteria bacterium MAG IRC1_bin_28]
MSQPSSPFTVARRGKPTSPLEVLLCRNGIAESVHRVHAAVTDQQGRLLMGAGDPFRASFGRSALKPLQASLLILTGAAEQNHLQERQLAIACASHRGTVTHARAAFHILWNAGLRADLLQCPVPSGAASPLQHNCSGKHAAFLAICKRMDWPLATYMDPDHPLQREVLQRLAELLHQPAAEFLLATDDCGVPTVQLQLAQLARVFAVLSSSGAPELERLCRAMQAHPELVAGDGCFDTEVMRLGLGALVSKGGSEGIQCLGRVNEGIGMAIKVEDGARRAKYAVALHLLDQLGWLTPEAMADLRPRFRNLSPHLNLQVSGELRFNGTG